MPRRDPYLLAQDGSETMLVKFIDFFQSEDGAVTVDWVVLTAGIVGLAGLTYTQLNGSLQELDEKTGSALENVQVVQLKFD